MKVKITEFKAKCTYYIRNINENHKSIEITKNGSVVAKVVPPDQNLDHNPAWGTLKGTVCNISGDFDEPLGCNDWEAAQ